MKWALSPIALAWLGSWYTTASAQCTGPGSRLLFRETFGTVSQPVDISDRTNHQFFPICPNDGQYTITNRSDSVCYHAWHQVRNDHTSTDGTGNMLIVNASYDSGEFYRQTLTRLCSRSSYEFSAWCINLINIHKCDDNSPLLPDLTIRIETRNGRLVKEYVVGYLKETPQPDWRRLSVTFTPPDVDEEVVVKLLNTGGGCGNDLALDDIELVQCRPCSEYDNPNAYKVLVPNAFSPNGDTLNDKLELAVGEAVIDVVTTIYDRWGSVIFVSDSSREWWDGTFKGVPCQDGLYACKVSYSYYDMSPVSHTQYGQVLLVR
ncbi:gliding motility-associated C-terminal domain-containing protein [Fibrella sp. WM1]|uniref:T9SS type B sorting domain-containing protein n=1 Tax=Fibrella musci TaxID=3242485 RepID=UPI0035224F68